MFKRVFNTLFLLLLTGLLVVGQAQAKVSQVFDLKNIEKGIVRVNCPLEDKKIKVMVQKGEATYYYDIKGDKNTIPLQLGSGVYTLSLLENLTGSKYIVKCNDSVQVKLLDEKIPFLQSASPVYWVQDSKAAKLAQSLTEKLDTDKEKALAIHDYIINNVKYDHDKITELEGDYIPSVDKIIYSGDGICFDYAVLYAAMLRSVNIPAKLVKGYKNDIDSYHAWNEVYIKELGWIIVDTTYDSAMLEDKISFKFIKDVSKYKKKKEY